MNSDDPELNELISNAEEQLRLYAGDEKFSKSIAKTQLIKLVLIFSTHEAVYVEEAKAI